MSARTPPPQSARAGDGAGDRGLAEVVYHCDGAEIHRDSESLIWTCQSFLSAGLMVSDIKALVCMIPCRYMRSVSVRRRVLEIVTTIISWDLSEIGRAHV